MKNKFNLGIAGNIGVGKTTLTEKLSIDLGFTPIYESVIDNPYLSDFYTDMSRWSFNLQIYFLKHRFSDQVNIMNCNYGAIQDRTVYEDVEIFAKNLYKMNYISERDWKTYIGLFENMVQFLKEPDLFIYLKASTDTLLSRIKNRNRDFEKTISPEYLHSLNISYDKWIDGIDKNKVLIIDTDKFNIFKDIDKLNAILTKIQAALD